MRNNSKARLAVEDGDISFHKPDNRTWRLACVLLVLLCLALLITVISLAVKDTSVSSSTQICNKPHCVKIAATLLENMDMTVNPCDNFFDFACGGWVRKNVIPEDLPSYSAFGMLREQVAIILKDLIEREGESNDMQAIVKVKNLYASCNDLETIEQRDADPLIKLLQRLGGWPVLKDLPGGQWSEKDFKVENLMGQLSGGYNNDILVSSYVTADDRNSSRNIIKIDQQELGLLSRKYFLDPIYEHYKMAYLHYMITIAVMLGADEDTAVADMTDVLEFETKLANLSTPEEERRDNEKLYNPTTIGELQRDVPEINWVSYFAANMPEHYLPVLESEPLINRAPEYISKMAKFVVNETPPSVVANYLIWRITKNRVTNLSRRFRDAEQEYNRIVSGTNSVPARWRNCVQYVRDAMEFATGRLYVLEHFGGDSKKNTERMVDNLKQAFKDMLKENEWMDKETKLVAAKKCDAMQVEVGYPDWIMDDDKLNEKYHRLNMSSDTFFENVIGFLNWTTYNTWLQLRKEVDQSEWQFSPAEVNAYYSSNKNQIVFPAAILQPPFYHAESPWYLNYGGIGMVIGHEITHGFDDRGRQYDMEGNLKDWWSNYSVENFKKRTKCMIDQYDNYVMPENNRTLNGIQTQGENIADNGGLAESFKAYQDYAKTSVQLPGLSNFTSEQLFFLNFAQVWCSAFRPEGVDSAILIGVHSPGRYRIIGPAHNSEDFVKAFKCRSSSFMNPALSSQPKCRVW
ncbi:neprilysin-1-like [Amphiura filiformis]|uniref:neprilysin-1-like n=1 Tax=Amphiura filiformis TaxID=82378 RepID=UPI003B21EB90